MEDTTAARVPLPKRDAIPSADSRHGAEVVAGGFRGRIAFETWRLQECIAVEHEAELAKLRRRIEGENSAIRQANATLNARVSELEELLIQNDPQDAAIKSRQAYASARSRSGFSNWTLQGRSKLLLSQSQSTLFPGGSQEFTLHRSPSSQSNFCRRAPSDLSEAVATSFGKSRAQSNVIDLNLDGICEGPPTPSPPLFVSPSPMLAERTYPLEASSDAHVSDKPSCEGQPPNIPRTASDKPSCEGHPPNFPRTNREISGGGESKGGIQELISAQLAALQCIVVSTIGVVAQHHVAQERQRCLALEEARSLRIEIGLLRDRLGLAATAGKSYGNDSATLPQQAPGASDVEDVRLAGGLGWHDRGQGATKEAPEEPSPSSVGSRAMVLEPEAETEGPVSSRSPTHANSINLEKLREARWSRRSLTEPGGEEEKGATRGIELDVQSSEEKIASEDPASRGGRPVEAQKRSSASRSAAMHGPVDNPWETFAEEIALSPPGSMGVENKRRQPRIWDVRRRRARQHRNVGPRGSRSLPWRKIRLSEDSTARDESEIIPTAVDDKLVTHAKASHKLDEPGISVPKGLGSEHTVNESNKTPALSTSSASPSSMRPGSLCLSPHVAKFHDLALQKLERREAAPTESTAKCRSSSACIVGDRDVHRQSMRSSPTTKKRHSLTSLDSPKGSQNPRHRRPMSRHSSPGIRKTLNCSAVDEMPSLASLLVPKEEVDRQRLLAALERSADRSSARNSGQGSDYWDDDGAFDRTPLHPPPPRQPKFAQASAPRLIPPPPMQQSKGRGRTHRDERPSWVHKDSSDEESGSADAEAANQPPPAALTMRTQQQQQQVPAVRHRTSSRRTSFKDWDESHRSLEALIAPPRPPHPPRWSLQNARQAGGGGGGGVGGGGGSSGQESAPPPAPGDTRAGVCSPSFVLGDDLQQERRSSSGLSTRGSRRGSVRESASTISHGRGASAALDNFPGDTRWAAEDEGNPEKRPRPRTSLLRAAARQVTTPLTTPEGGRNLRPPGAPPAPWESD